jgi:sugar phosphate permease
MTQRREKTPQKFGAPAATGAFYGWKMVAAGTGLQFLQAALLQYSFGAYVAVIQQERGWSKTGLSGAAALHQVEAALLGPVLGWVIDRFGAQGLIRAGVVVFGAGMMLLSFSESLAGFYAAFVVVALGLSLCGFFPLNVALINWFERKRARALSTMALGLSFGGIAVPLVAWSLQEFGWRATAFGSGVIAIAVGLPLAMVIRRRPEDYGMVVDGAPAAQDESPRAQGEPKARDFTAREALRTPAFWLLSLGHGFALLVVGAVNVHAITHMVEGLGYSIGAASLVITLVMLSQMSGIMLGWWIGDRFDKRLIAAACMFGHMAGLLLLTYAAMPAMVLAFAVLHGVSWGLRGPFMPAIRADYFGRSAIGTILGLSFMIVVVGQSGGPLVAGFLADVTGSYRAGFTLLAVLAGLGSAFFLLAKRPALPPR